MSTRIEVDRFDFSSLHGKSALILGGGSGSGLYTALTLAKAGAKVTVADILPHDSVVSLFQSQGLGVQYVKCDVTFWQQQVMAFKQAIHYAPSQSLDLVCCFAAVDKRQDLVEEAKQGEPRIDGEPSATDLEEVDVNLKGVSDSTKLAFHYFRVPDRATTIRRARPGTPSSTSSTTRSSVRSRSHSRSGSRPGSRSGSRSRSPVPIDPSLPTVTPEAANPSEKKEEATEDSRESEESKDEKEIIFTKCLVIVSGLSAYMDDGHSSFYSASNFALRGLFRSIRTKARDELGVRVNLVAPWALRTPMIEPFLKKLEDDGVIEREEVHEEEKSSHVDELHGEESKENDKHNEELKENNEITEGVTEPQPGSDDGTNAAVAERKDENTANEMDSPRTNEVARESSEVIPNGNAQSQTEAVVERSQIASSEIASEVEQTQAETVVELPQLPSSEVVSEVERNQTSELQAQEPVLSVQSPTPSAQDPVTSIRDPVPSTLETTPLAQDHSQEANSEQQAKSSEVKEPKSPTSDSQMEQSSKASPSSAPTSTETPKFPVNTEVQYKNMHFASLADVANTVTRLCADTSLSGRAMAVLPEGVFDLQDDHEGVYAGEQVKKLLDMRREAGDLLCKLWYLIPGSV